MSGEAKIIWPHPSPLQDWWTQVMSVAHNRVSTCVAKHERAVPIPATDGSEKPT